MGVVENRPRNATARAASEVEVEILTPIEFFDQITGSPRVVRELIQRLSRRLREADDRIVNDERRSGGAQEARKNAESQTAVESAPLRIRGCGLSSKVRSGSAICGSSLAGGLLHERACRRCSPDLKLDDTAPFRLSRNHFMIEKRDGNYYVRDLRSTLARLVRVIDMRQRLPWKTVSSQACRCSDRLRNATGTPKDSRGKHGARLQAQHCSGTACRYWAL
jgi:hypothetical protein